MLARSLLVVGAAAALAAGCGFSTADGPVFPGAAASRSSAVRPLDNPCRPTPTSCRRSTGAKTVSGTLRGADGRYLDAMLGFDILDASGRKIRPDGTPVTDGGYGAFQRLNFCVGSAGAASAVPGCAGAPVTDAWSLALPADAVQVYVEAYPKRPTASNWIAGYHGYTGPDPGGTDESTYGMTYRRSIPVRGSGATGIRLLAPRVCGQPGGSTGSLWGYLYRDGTPWRPASGSTNAWSTEPDDTRILGMNEGGVDPGAGTYHITNLQARSHYTVVATIDGVTRQWLAGVQPEVGATCSSTRFDLHF